ncbi:MAG: class I SAM-dependent methyltransferase [Gammaproteobacteria bacterium]|nr:class I SAM-dependent methyltransferase [Gammaproteobacteria bacterium]
MSNKTLQLNDQLYQYLLDFSLRESATQLALRQATAKLPVAQMQIAPEQGQFMGLLVTLMGAKKTLEIGVFTGYSTLAVAQALPPEGKIVACDVSEEWTNLAKPYWEQAQVLSKIELHLAPALDTLDNLLNDKAQHESFDFAFIDADKAHYSLYYEKSLKLIRKGGLIAIDNTLWAGDVAKSEVKDASTQAIRALNEKLKHDERIMLSLVPIADGLTLALKR